LITGSRAAYLGLGAGLIYFLLFFPKKMRAIKIAAILILMAGTSVVVYANTQSKFPDFLEKNRIFSSIQPRLSINAFLEDARFPAWMTGIKAVSERPILGWGPENFSVGFNKYYTPSIGAEWWDRAHNILIQTASDAGILAALIYLALFVFLIWQLNKVEDKILARGLQAILIGYFIANFFSIDSPPIYILFFFTIGYCLCLTSKSAAEKETASKNLKPIKWGKPALAVLFVLLIIFLWQYNLNPLFINAKINDSEVFVSQNKCNQAMTLMDKAISSKSFLDSYARLKYVEYVKTCAGYQPQKNLEYTQKSIQLLKEVTNMQPTYARAWLFLGSLNTILAKQESDQGKKNELVKEAFLNLDKAEQFAPSHQEIFSERAKAYQVSGDYQAMHKESEKCLSIFKSAGSCYWTKALSEIYLKNYNAADEDIRLAEKYLFRVTAQSSLFDLVNAYADVQNYKKTIETYQKLIIWDDNRPEYHSSIAFAYYKMGEYAKAREQALLFLELMPQAKDEVNNFLKTLPY
jgi:tetratricopeptide (TPR) repeat protein